MVNVVLSLEHYKLKGETVQNSLYRDSFNRQLKKKYSDIGTANQIKNQANFKASPKSKNIANKAFENNLKKIIKKHEISDYKSPIVSYPEV